MNRQKVSPTNHILLSYSQCSLLFASYQVRFRFRYLRGEGESCNGIFKFTRCCLLQKMFRIGVIKWEAATNHSVKNDTKTPHIASHSIIRDTWNATNNSNTNRLDQFCQNDIHVRQQTWQLNCKIHVRQQTWQLNCKTVSFFLI